MLRSDGLHFSPIRSIYASSSKMVCASIPQGYTANRWFGPTTVCGSRIPRLTIYLPYLYCIRPQNMVARRVSDINRRRITYAPHIKFYPKPMTRPGEVFTGTRWFQGQVKAITYMEHGRIQRYYVSIANSFLITVSHPITPMLYPNGFRSTEHMGKWRKMEKGRMGR